MPSGSEVSSSGGCAGRAAPRPARPTTQAAQPGGDHQGETRGASHVAEDQADVDRLGVEDDEQHQHDGHEDQQRGDDAEAEGPPAAPGARRGCQAGGPFGRRPVRRSPQRRPALRWSPASPGGRDRSAAGGSAVSSRCECGPARAPVHSGARTVRRGRVDVSARRAPSPRAARRGRPGRWRGRRRPAELDVVGRRRRAAQHAALVSRARRGPARVSSRAPVCRDPGRGDRCATGRGQSARAGPASWRGWPVVRSDCFIRASKTCRSPPDELVAGPRVEVAEGAPVVVVEVLDDLEGPAVGDHVAARRGRGRGRRRARCAPAVAQQLDGVLQQPVGLAGQLVEAVQQAAGLLDGLEGLGELAEALDGGVVEVGAGAVGRSPRILVAAARP